MAYTKTTWVNGQTPLNATNMNKIEDELELLDSISTSQGERLTTAEGTITSQGNRLTTAEGTITSQGNRLTTAEGEIESLDDRVESLEDNQLPSTEGQLGKFLKVGSSGAMWVTPPVSGTTSGNNWATITIDGETKNIPTGTGGKQLYLHNISAWTSLYTDYDCRAYITIINDSSTEIDATSLQSYLRTNGFNSGGINPGRRPYSCTGWCSVTASSTTTYYPLVWIAHTGSGNVLEPNSISIGYVSTSGLQEKEVFNETDLLSFTAYDKVVTL